MAEQVLKGAPVAKALTERLVPQVEALVEKGVRPTLAIVRVGEREDDLSYERGATKRAEKVGLGLRKFVLPADCSQEWLADVIREVNEDPSIHGCLLFRPLPKTLDEVAVCAALDPAKDVDCITTGSLYGVFANRPVGFPPCTAEAVIELLGFYGYDLTGARAVAYQMAEEMVRTDPMDVLGFEQKWIALQEKITETLPLIPVYSNAYFDFYTRELHDYSILDAISWADAVSRSYISDREELQKGEKEAQIRDLNNMAEEYRIEPRTE